MTDIPEAYLAKAEAALHGMAFYSRPEYSSALVRVASALMEAEASGEARGMERAAKIAELHVDASICDKSWTATEAGRLFASSIATAIRDRGGKNE